MYEFEEYARNGIVRFEQRPWNFSPVIGRIANFESQMDGVHRHVKGRLVFRNLLTRFYSLVYSAYRI